MRDRVAFTSSRFARLRSDHGTRDRCTLPPDEGTCPECGTMYPLERLQLSWSLGYGIRLSRRHAPNADGDVRVSALNAGEVQAETGNDQVYSGTNELILTTGNP